MRTTQGSVNARRQRRGSHGQFPVKTQQHPSLSQAHLHTHTHGGQIKPVLQGLMLMQRSHVPLPQGEGWGLAWLRRPWVSPSPAAYLMESPSLSILTSQPSFQFSQHIRSLLPQGLCTCSAPTYSSPTCSSQLRCHLPSKGAPYACSVYLGLLDRTDLNFTETTRV